jgi:hypothetical protein
MRIVRFCHLLSGFVSPPRKRKWKEVETGGTPTQKEWKQVEQIPPYSTSFHLFPRVSTLKLFLGRNFTLIAVRRMRVRSHLTSSLFQRVPAYSNVFFF